MPSKIKVAQQLENKYLNSAPKANRENIKRVRHTYRNNRNVTINIAEKVVMALYLPSAFGHVGKKGEPGKADEIYEDFLSRYQESNAEQRERISGIKRNYQLRVVLPTRNLYHKTRRRRGASSRESGNTTEPSARGCCSTGRDT
jgi:hypothetical protein